MKMRMILTGLPWVWIRNMTSAKRCSKRHDWEWAEGPHGKWFVCCRRCYYWEMLP